MPCKCAERRQAIARAIEAVANGEPAAIGEAARAARFVGSSLREDAAAMARVAAARLSAAHARLRR